MITKEKIYEALESLKGTEYNTYSFGSNIWYALKPLFVEAGLPTDWTQDNKYITYNTEAQTMYLIYAGGTVAQIKVKKVKGKKHHNYFGSYCEWTIGDFQVFIYAGEATVEDRLKRIDEFNIQMKAKADAHLESLVDYMKTVMQATGYSFDEIIIISEDIRNKKYNEEFQKKCLQSN